MLKLFRPRSIISRLKNWLGRRRLSPRRVPVIHQLCNTECGLACLAMILGYYGRKTPLSELRAHFGIGRDGTTALTISQAARAYGLRVKAYSLGTSEFEQVTLPAIVHWNFNHFIVIERWSSQSIQVVDPAAGRRQLSDTEFDSGFTGVVLMFEPGLGFERRRRGGGRPIIRYLYACARHVPGWFLQVVAASLLLQVLGLAVPVATKILIDHVLPFRITGIMTILGLGLLFILITQALITYLRSMLLLHLQFRLDSQMMIQFFDHLLTLPFRFFQQRTSGDLLMRLGSNAVIREILTGQTLSLVLDGGLVLIYLVILWSQQSRLGLLAFGLGALQIILLSVTARRMRDLSHQELTAQARSQSYLVEALSQIEVVKTSGREAQVLNHWSSLLHDHLEVSFRRNHLSAWIDTTMSALKTFTPLALLWTGTSLVLAGELSLGTMLALNALAAAFLAPLSSLATNGQRLQLVGSHLERIADVLEAAPEQDPQTTLGTPQMTGQIEIRRLGFRYDAISPPALIDISITIRPAQKVALVGRTGAGKSSLAKLLLGLYPPTAGEILYDGLPLSALNYRQLRRQFGVIHQETQLFSGSIRQNIAFCDMQMPLDRVIEAARLSMIHDEIMQMPMGYETLIAEGNHGLSGGQCQRLALARALAHRPAVLLLDEATSHLDVETERLIEENLDDLSCTRIVIAHRLSTIRNADVIYVLEQGRIVEQGSHEELLARSGSYASLIENQLMTADS
ncbi:MAG TPA: peptidase domain-containing ABC transporter [Blastocatellia bacterium]|nr:peptidase domain-containing ABC transporter [Blastocatellia bacterium]